MVSDYDKGIEVGARAAWEATLPNNPNWSWEKLAPSDRANICAEFRAGVEAFLSVQPTLQWCEVHEAEAIDFCWRAAFIMLEPAEAKTQCRIVEQRRVDGV